MEYLYYFAGKNVETEANFFQKMPNDFFSSHCTSLKEKAKYFIFLKANLPTLAAAIFALELKVHDFSRLKSLKTYSLALQLTGLF